MILHVMVYTATMETDVRRLTDTKTIWLGLKLLQAVRSEVGELIEIN
jgi:hypothetical protein